MTNHGQTFCLDYLGTDLRSKWCFGLGWYILLNKDSDLGIENQRDNEGEMSKNVTFELSGFLLGGKVEEFFEGDEEEDKEEEVFDEDHEV